jgi:hypothetical protein
MRSPFCLCVYNLLTSEPIGIFFTKFGRGGKAIEGNFDDIIYDAVAATIPKCRNLKLLRWM